MEDSVPTWLAENVAKYEKEDAELDPMLRYKHTPPADWLLTDRAPLDFSTSYVLHAFDGGYPEIEWTPEIILARRSNLSIALYPVVKQALDVGLLKIP